ncbi:expressed unknown protein [Seminavis robusta]|uniref:Uncharacterized protein n=1 Tax=Seminavis robusta TaxID=568900 RepID=A0A9N8EMY1_9STRA|nr:expressed unknown protein [Seminavis robusta]|eukprot:Sro1197_g251570.1 n/a (310) ;mRNA; r:28810-29739
MAAAGAAAAAEMERAAAEATKIVSSLLYLGDSVDVNTDSSLRSWHRSNLSFGEAYALLWQQDDQGGRISHSEDSNARLMAAHLIDLLFAGRVKLYWGFKTSLLKGQYGKLRLMISSTNGVEVAATTKLLQHLGGYQDERRASGKNPISLNDFILLHIGDANFEKRKGIGYELEKETFGELISRGILTEEKKKSWVFFQKTVYPTSDPTPEAMLVQDLRAVLKGDMPSTPQLEILLKLISRTTKVFTAEEEAADKELQKRRKAFKHDDAFTLVEQERQPVEGRVTGYNTSPFSATQELSVRLVVDQAELC